MGLGPEGRGEEEVGGFDWVLCSEFAFLLPKTFCCHKSSLVSVFEGSITFVVYLFFLFS